MTPLSDTHCVPTVMVPNTAWRRGANMQRQQSHKQKKQERAISPSYPGYIEMVVRYPRVRRRDGVKGCRTGAVWSQRQRDGGWQLAPSRVIGYDTAPRLTFYYSVWTCGCRETWDTGFPVASALIGRALKFGVINALPVRAADTYNGLTKSSKK